MGARPIEIVGLGEILWDLLPGGRQLGGAPFNFAFHCHQLGHATTIVSRVGQDDLGRAIRESLCGSDLSDTYLQEDTEHPTGTVAVDVDPAGQPTFTIREDVAYDYLTWEDRLEALFCQAEAVCFGTLVQRHPIARATVQRALHSAREALVVYDVNLRQHYFSLEIIEASLHASRWVKLNEGELSRLQDLLKLAGPNASTCLADLRQRYDLELACLTRGEHGCLVQTADEEIAVPGLHVHVVDTVGAGDAFTAGLLVYALEGRTLADAVVFANRLAARVAASAGGTPRLVRADVAVQLPAQPEPAR
ncbi:MAG: carbohydrate kinase [Gemmataceae bacterium]|nr:carbohydrate kinase [Gemmataceae bacterium]